jgi:dTDP-4-dehydrorhamnose 3,5-epimerase
MNFEPLPLQGAFRILLQKHSDSRGSFARTFCTQEFETAGLPSNFVQCNTSFNLFRSTLRGMHWQAAPHAEGKLVRATRGSLFDVLVDIRPESPTFGQWHGEELSADNGIMLFIPQGFAHGFLTLVDSTELFYQMTTPFVASAARGARFDDPFFQIKWPADPQSFVISQRDLDFKPFAIDP